MNDIIVILFCIALLFVVFFTVVRIIIVRKRSAKEIERGIKMVPLLIHIPPKTDDIKTDGRDGRDVTGEILDQAQTMYSIIFSTAKKRNVGVYGQRHVSFEIVSVNNSIKYYVMVPLVLAETIKQAVLSAYPTARLENARRENIFSKEGKIDGVVGGELSLKKEAIYPIVTYRDTKKDASLALLNAMSSIRDGEGVGVQIMMRPANDDWKKGARIRVQNIQNMNTKNNISSNAVDVAGNLAKDMVVALWRPPDEHEKSENLPHELTGEERDEISGIEEKIKYPAFEVLVRIVASASGKDRANAVLSGVVTAFSQFDSPNRNGFRYDEARDIRQLVSDYILRRFPINKRSCVLNSIELTSIYHLPEQGSIPTSQVERQSVRQVDAPAHLMTNGLLLGVNDFRGEKKEIRLSDDDRRRHVYVVGATGMGKSVLLGNLAYQDMLDGKGFAFIDPHGDVVEDILSKVPQERIDDVIYFDPGDLENPIGMNMFEYETADQKDFIVQEGINMLYSLYDPEHSGIFGPRGEHMFRNAALLLMSDPNGATFIDIPKCFIDPEFVKSKLKYVTDRSVYDYWTKEFPASQRSNDAGEVTTWFVSKWGPFLSNTMMKNILGQTKSGFNIRDIMDNKKILLVNLSKGRMGEMNSKLLGMIFVMKFQTAAMSRVNIPEEEREDFCLFVDEFQNFSTDSFESILSEARKFRLNLVVANQFVTQLTDKIREGILGNVGTIISGRLGVTDAELLEKVYAPVFNAEDLHKLPNHHAVATVMMYGMPSSPFTMALLPPMGEKHMDVLASLKKYVAVKYGKPRVAVEREIDDRMSGKIG